MPLEQTFIGVTDKQKVRQQVNAVSACCCFRLRGAESMEGMGFLSAACVFLLFMLSPFYVAVAVVDIFALGFLMMGRY